MNRFRATEKTRANFLLPVELDAKLREARGRRSLSEVTALALCEHLGVDPAQFGLRRPGEAVSAN